MINIKATNIEITEPINKYLDNKLVKLNKFFKDKDDDAVKIDVELGKTTMHHKSGDIFKAEINVSLDGQRFRAVAETSDLYGSIDKMENEIISALRSFKGKKESLFKRGGQRVKGMLKGWRR